MEISHQRNETSDLHQTARFQIGRNILKDLKLVLVVGGGCEGGPIHPSSTKIEKKRRKKCMQYIQQGCWFVVHNSRVSILLLLLHIGTGAYTHCPPSRRDCNAISGLNFACFFVQHLFGIQVGHFI